MNKRISRNNFRKHAEFTRRKIIKIEKIKGNKK